jgi:UDP-glucose 4-epimerase
VPTAVVTGSSGLVGSAVAGALARDGWDVRGLDVTAGPRTTAVGDLRDGGLRRGALRGAGAVVHAAALHAPHVGRRPDAEFRAVNVDATRELLADAAAAGVTRFVFVSSTSVYGHALVPVDGRAVWVDDALPPRPRDIYDETKLAAESLVTAAPVPAVTLRISRCFPEPPRDLAVHRLHRGVDLTDVVAAVRLATVRTGARGTFTISGPHPFTPADRRRLHDDAAALITERLPRVAEAFAARGWALPASIDRVYDSSAATAAFGYRPLVGAAEALS